MWITRNLLSARSVIARAPSNRTTKCGWARLTATAAQHASRYQFLTSQSIRTTKSTISVTTSRCSRWRHLSRSQTTSVPSVWQTRRTSFRRHPSVTPLDGATQTMPVRQSNLFSLIDCICCMEHTCACNAILSAIRSVRCFECTCTCIIQNSAASAHDHIHVMSSAVIWTCCCYRPGATQHVARGENETVDKRRLSEELPVSE